MGKRGDETRQDWDPLDSERKMRLGNSSTPKVQGNSNLADLMTKNVNRRTMDKMAALLQQHFKEGRAANSLHLQTASGWDQVQDPRESAAAC